MGYPICLLGCFKNLKEQRFPWFINEQGIPIHTYVIILLYFDTIFRFSVDFLLYILLFSFARFKYFILIIIRQVTTSKSQRNGTVREKIIMNFEGLSCRKRQRQRYAVAEFFVENLILYKIISEQFFSTWLRFPSVSS